MAQNLINALKKITRWSLWSAAGCMLLVVLLHFLLPLLLDSQMLTRKIRAQLDPETYGSIDFAGLRLALLPLPAVIATQVRYALPDRVQFQAEEVAVHPQLLSLLRGRLRLATLAVQAPSVVVHLPAGSGQPSHPGQAQGPSPDPLSERLSKALARLPQNGQVLLNQGMLTLQQGGHPLIRFKDLALTLTESDGRLHLELAGGSNLIDHFQVMARLDSRSLDGQGDLQLNGIRLNALSDKALPEPIRQSRVEAEGDLRLAFETKGLKSLLVSLRTELPAIAIANGTEAARAQQISVEASAELDPQGVRATLNQLRVEQPRLNLDGRLIWDTASASNSSALQLDLNLRDTDATGVRAMMAKMAAWNLWETLLGGTLEEMALHTSGATWGDLGQMRNLRIEGKASQAQIVVPGVQLPLTEVNGAWKLENGVLSVAPGAAARCGGIQARNAALTVGLADPPQPIDLALDFNADLADLPGLLKKVIPSDQAQAELARVGRTNGRAAGSLRLSGSVQDLHVRVAVRDITLTAQYDRLPLPVQIKGPELAYTDGQITFRALSTVMGATSLDTVSGRVAWQPASALTLQGRTVRLSGDELFPWLRKLPGLQTKVGSIQSIAGTLQLSDLSINGSTAAPGPWQFQGEGAFDVLTVGLAQISAPVTLGDGRFRIGTPPATQKDIKAKRVGTRLDIQQLNLACAEQRAALSGTILFGAQQLQPVLALSSDRLDLGRLVPLFSSSPAPNSKSAPPKQPGADVDGRVSVTIEHLDYGSYQWAPVRAEATLSKGQTILNVTKADLCGISTVGRLVWNDQGMRLEVKPSTLGKSVQYKGGCLSGSASTERIEGTLNLEGRISAAGSDVPELLANLGGELQMSARDGRIFNVGRAGLFTNLLSFLSINNIVRGQKLDLSQNDLPYKSIESTLQISKGVAKLQDTKFISQPINIVGEGNVDLKTQETDIILLVSPLTTADAVVQRIPLVSKILKGTIMVVPVEIKGPLTNPKILPMSPKAVGSRLLGIMERTVTAPLQLVDPFLKTKESAPPPDE